MSLSSFCVVTNALRLNLFKFKTATEDQFMTRTLHIEGMMCPHCEARVKKALEAIDGVDSATVNHTLGTAVVALSRTLDDSVLKSAVEAEDYPVTSIE